MNTGPQIASILAVENPYAFLNTSILGKVPRYGIKTTQIEPESLACACHTPCGRLLKPKGRCLLICPGGSLDRNNSMSDDKRKLTDAERARLEERSRRFTDWLRQGMNAKTQTSMKSNESKRVPPPKAA
jgi:hypothetical protein